MPRPSAMTADLRTCVDRPSFVFSDQLLTFRAEGARNRGRGAPL